LHAAAAEVAARFAAAVDPFQPLRG
jgi:hypothetical protein